MEKNRLKERLKDEMPYERALKYGAQSLTDVELLAVLLRKGTCGMDVISMSEAILSNNYAYEGLSSILHLTYEELTDIRGVGEVKAVQILCLSELCRRLWKAENISHAVEFNTPTAIAGFYQQEMKYMEREALKIAFLDISMRFICDTTLTTGTINQSLASVREVMIEALRHRAMSIVIVHNHPSGKPNPSEEDINFTDRIKRACDSVGLSLTDHLIIGENSYFSFRERDMIQ